MKGTDLRKRKLDYTWVIVVLCFLSVCVSMGLCSSGRNMYLTAITDALDIKRSAFSLNDTFRYVTTTIVSLFLGTLINKFGTKTLLCTGFVSLIGFALINSAADKLYEFYIGGILLGLGLSFTSATLISVVINRWCKKNKGTVTGAVLAANGLGGAIAAQIISPIIFEEGNPFGYRNSYRLVALVLAVMLVLIILFFRNTPKGEEAAPVTIAKKRKIRGTGWVGMDYAEAVKKPYYYFALACMALIGFSLQGLVNIATPHMYDVGLEKPFVANIMTMSSLCLMGSKFLSGWLYDHKGMRLTMSIGFGAAFFALAALFFISNTPFGRALAVVRVLFSAMALPLETVMISLFAAELFGNKSFDKIVGMFSAASTAGFALGAPFSNLCYDLRGNYNIPFAVFFVLMLIVTVTMEIVLTKANRDKKVILAKAEQEAAAAAENASSV